MAAAANYGRANRQLLTEAARAAFETVAGAGPLDLLYDVSHNLAKIESHVVEGRTRRLCVHRKGATRALPPGHPDLPPSLRATGQPVLLPGSMGTASYVLVGIDPGAAFGSAAHGAGRVMSRHAAHRRIGASQLLDDLGAHGVTVRAASRRGLVEEAPLAYKDVDEVAAVCDAAGLARRVARLRPIGVVKG
jgi:tRNA-splicing ligase RtcB